MQLKGNIYFHSWWYYLRDSRCQIVQCLLEASSKFGNWNWLNPLSHFCNFIIPYGHYRSPWQSPGLSSALSQNIQTEVKHIEDTTVSNKDISERAAKSLRNAGCYLNESIFVNKMLSTFGLWGLTTRLGVCWTPAPQDHNKAAGLKQSMTLRSCWTPWSMVTPQLGTWAPRYIIFKALQSLTPSCAGFRSDQQTKLCLVSFPWVKSNCILLKPARMKEGSTRRVSKFCTAIT